MYFECMVSQDGMLLHADSALSRFCIKNTPLNYGWLCPMIEGMFCLQHGYCTLVHTYVWLHHTQHCVASMYMPLTSCRVNYDIVPP